VVIIDAAAGALDDALTQLAQIPGPVFAAMPARQRMRVELQLAWSLHRVGRLEEAEVRGRRALQIAEEGPLGLDDLIRGAREVVVYAMLDGGRAEDAEAFLAPTGEPTNDLAAAIAGRQLIDTYNAGVEAINGGDSVRAVELFGEVWADGEVEETRRESVGGALSGALRARGHALWEAGSLEAAAAAFARAAEVAGIVGDVPAQARALVNQASVRGDGGDAQGAAALAQEAAELAGTTDRKLAGDSWMIAGQALFETDTAGSRTAFVRALEAWGTSPETLGSRASVTYNLAVLEFNTGTPQEAKVRLEEARILARQAGKDGLAAQIESLFEAIDDEE
jgi:tetratricopeptide (TPR) repeat protein